MLRGAALPEGLEPLDGYIPAERLARATRNENEEAAPPPLPPSPPVEPPPTS